MGLCMPRRRTVSGYKACTACKLIVPEESPQCPNCGSTEFTYTWRGMAIIINVEKSCIAKRLGVEKPGMYAIEVITE